MLSAAYQLDEKTVLRGGFGLFYGPGQFEDRIQPIENFIERRRVQMADVPNNGLQYPCHRHSLGNLLSIRGYTHDYPNEYNVQYGVSLSRELPGEINLTVGYTGSQGKDMFLRGVGNTLDFNDARAAGPLRPDRLQDRRLRRRTRHRRLSPSRAAATPTYDALQLSATRRFRAGFTGGMQYQYSRNKGTTQGSNEAATTQNTFDYETEYGTNPQDIPHTFNGSLVYLIPGEGLLKGGWRVGGIVNARSGVPINVDHRAAGQRDVNGATVTNIPGGNSRGTQRPDLVPGVDPYLEGRRALAEPGGVRHAAARDVRQPSAQLPARPGFCAVRLDVQQGLALRERQGIQVRVEIFNIANRLNYENPVGGAAERHAGRAVHRCARPARSATCSGRSIAPWAWARRGRHRSRCVIRFRVGRVGLVGLVGLPAEAWCNTRRRRRVWSVFRATYLVFFGAIHLVRTIARNFLTAVALAKVVSSALRSQASAPPPLAEWPRQC